MCTAGALLSIVLYVCVCVRLLVCSHGSDLNQLSTPHSLPPHAPANRKGVWSALGPLPNYAYWMVSTTLRIWCQGGSQLVTSGLQSQSEASQQSVAGQGKLNFNLNLMQAPMQFKMPFTVNFIFLYLSGLSWRSVNACV